MAYDHASEFTATDGASNPGADAELKASIVTIFASFRKGCRLKFAWNLLGFRLVFKILGAVAHLVERGVEAAEAVGSSPTLVRHP